MKYAFEHSKYDTKEWHEKKTNKLDSSHKRLYNVTDILTKWIRQNVSKRIAFILREKYESHSKLEWNVQRSKSFEESVFGLCDFHFGKITTTSDVTNGNDIKRIVIFTLGADRLFSVSTLDINYYDYYYYHEYRQIMDWDICLYCSSTVHRTLFQKIY